MFIQAKEFLIHFVTSELVGSHYESHKPLHTNYNQAVHIPGRAGRYQKKGDGTVLL